MCENRAMLRIVVCLAPEYSHFRSDSTLIVRLFSCRRYLRVGRYPFESVIAGYPLTSIEAAFRRQFYQSNARISRRNTKRQLDITGA